MALALTTQPFDRPDLLDLQWAATALLVVAGLFTVAGCGPGSSPGCESKSDCRGDRLCAGGTCMSASRASEEHNDIVDITAGGHGTCVIFDNGRIDCWGDLGDWKKLMSEPPDDDHDRYLTPTPMKRLKTGSDPSEIVFNGNHGCLRTGANDTVYCWGVNECGEVGVPGPDQGVTYQEYTEIDGLQQVTDLAVGGDYSCAVEQNGTVKCWGALQSRSNCGETFRPIRIPGLEDAVEVHIGSKFACADRREHRTTCWRTHPSRGNPGEGPDFFNLGTIEDIDKLWGAGWVDEERKGLCLKTSAGQFRCRDADGFETSDWWPSLRTYAGWLEQSCAVLPDRTVECTHIYLGRGDDYRERWDNPGDFGQPETVEGLSSIEQIRMTEAFRCAVRADAEVFCWGYNTDAELGNGKTGPGTKEGEFVSPEFAPRD